MKKLSDRKILVTGAAGFIGSHVVEHLLERGAGVSAFVRYTSTGEAGFLDEFEADARRAVTVIYGDIRNRDDVMRAVKGNDTVIHLAAQIAIPYSYISPADFLTVNAVGSLNVLSAARDLNIKRVVHLSTSEVYGTAQYLPIDEAHPLVAQSPYSASKIAADKLAESFHRSYGIPVVIARPFNTFGPRQSARAVIPAIILQALRGSTVHLGNVATRRDLNFVTDTAAALVKMAVSRRGAGGQFNIATGQDFAIADIVAMVGDILGKKLIIKTDRRRVRPAASEVMHLRGDGSLADRTFRLSRRTDIRDGLRATVAYFEARLDRLHKEDYQL